MLDVDLDAEVYRNSEDEKQRLNYNVDGGFIQLQLFVVICKSRCLIFWVGYLLRTSRRQQPAPDNLLDTSIYRSHRGLRTRAVYRLTFKKMACGNERSIFCWIFREASEKNSAIT